VEADPFALPPRLWFGLLCEAVGTDQVGRLNFQAVFNQIVFLEPPETSGVAPHAFLNGILVVGFTEGLGHYEVTVQLRNVEDQVLWERPEGNWVFDVGPDAPTAILAEQVRYWLTQTGRYHFLARLMPGGQEYAIPFEVGRQIGPVSVVEGDQPGAQR
jgi:hypothetical protein